MQVGLAVPNLVIFNNRVSGRRGVSITTKVIVCPFYITIGFIVLFSRSVGLIPSNIFYMWGTAL